MIRSVLTVTVFASLLLLPKVASANSSDFSPYSGMWYSYPLGGQMSFNATTGVAVVRRSTKGIIPCKNNSACPINATIQFTTKGYIKNKVLKGKVTGGNDKIIRTGYSVELNGNPGSYIEFQISDAAGANMCRKPNDKPCMVN